MSASLPFQSSPRCHARSKRTGKPCQSPAITGWKVCRHHGAGGGAPKGERNGNYKNGFYTIEARADRRETAFLIKATRYLLKGL